MLFDKNTVLSSLLQMRKYLLQKMWTLIHEIIKVVHYVRDFIQVHSNPTLQSVAL